MGSVALFFFPLSFFFAFGSLQNLSLLYVTICLTIDKKCPFGIALLGFPRKPHTAKLYLYKEHKKKSYLRIHFAALTFQADVEVVSLT